MAEMQKKLNSDTILERVIRTFIEPVPDSPEEVARSRAKLVLFVQMSGWPEVTEAGVREISINARPYFEIQTTTSTSANRWHEGIYDVTWIEDLIP